MDFLPYTKWTYPTDIRVGAGRIKETARDCCRNMHVKAADRYR